ncbi:MAG: hypothetical protein RLO17_26010 [Cyclobacteriaceae bacterium]
MNVLIDFKQWKRNGLSLIFLFIFSIQLTSCYEPEDYVPPVFLESEVSLVVDNISWDSVSNGEIHIDLQRDQFTFGIQNRLLNAAFGCTVSRNKNVEAKLFHEYSAEKDLAIPKLGTYRTNDTIAVRMVYQLHGVGDDSDGRPDYDYWSATDAEFNVLKIDDAFIEDLEVYVSGSFEARAEHSTDKQFPRYRYIEGSFKNVRVTRIYQN